MARHADSPVHLDLKAVGSTVGGRARLLILRNIAHFPQHDSGSSVIIADELLNNLGKPDALTLSDIGHIRLNPAWDAEYVQIIHFAHGINLAPSSVLVGGFIYSFAMDALNKIREAVLRHIGESGVTPPECFSRAVAEFKVGDPYPVPVRIDHDAIALLHTSLLEYPKLAELVRQDIGVTAQRFRGEATEQRQASAVKGRREHPMQ